MMYDDIDWMVGSLYEDKNSICKLFADFEGRKVSEVAGQVCYAKHDGMYEVLYFESWNWVMRLWAKFRDLGIKSELYESHCRMISESILKTDIEATCGHLNQAITWYMRPLKWWNNLASLRKTQICDTNTDLVGAVRRWETLNEDEIRNLFLRLKV